MKRPKELDDLDRCAVARPMGVTADEYTRAYAEALARIPSQRSVVQRAGEYLGEREDRWFGPAFGFVVLIGSICACVGAVTISRWVAEVWR